MCLEFCFDFDDPVLEENIKFLFKSTVRCFVSDEFLDMDVTVDYVEWVVHGNRSSKLFFSHRIANGCAIFIISMNIT